jgi:hypothetical protein
MKGLTVRNEYSEKAMKGKRLNFTVREDVAEVLKKVCCISSLNIEDHGERSQFTPLLPHLETLKMI